MMWVGTLSGVTSAGIVISSARGGTCDIRIENHGKANYNREFLCMMKKQWYSLGIKPNINIINTQPVLTAISVGNATGQK